MCVCVCVCVLLLNESAECGLVFEWKICIGKVSEECVMKFANIPLSI